MSIQVRLIKPYSLHSKGAVLTLDAGVADALIRSGRAEAVTDEPPKDEKPEEKSNKPCRPSKTTKRRL